MLLGQVLSALNTATGIFSEELVQTGLNIPVFQMFCLYVSLCVGYTPVLVRFRFGGVRICNLWKFLVASAFDSQANVTLVLSFQYTSITSVYILLNCSLLWVVLLSYFCLKWKYSSKEFAGVLLSVIGIICVVISDLDSVGWTWAGSIKGDCIALFSSFLYAASNVWQEYMMTSGFKNYEYLSVLGFFSGCVTIIESLSLELSDIVKITTLTQLCMLGLYSITPFYFKSYGATIFNMSLLTSIPYALVFSVYLFGQPVQWLYFLAYAFVVSGILLYNYVPTPVDSDLSEELQQQGKSSS